MQFFLIEELLEIVVKVFQSIKLKVILDATGWPNKRNVMNTLMYRKTCIQTFKNLTKEFLGYINL